MVAYPMRGRKPKPPEQREKDGSKKRPTHEENPPEYEPGEPECPEHLTGLARDEWTRLCGRLFRAGTLTHEAMSTMFGYCLMWSEVIECDRLVVEYGKVMRDEKGKLYRNPAVAMRNDAAKLLASFASELGITPSSRGRVQAVKVEKEDPKKRFFKVVG